MLVPPPEGGGTGVGVLVSDAEEDDDLEDVSSVVLGWPFSENEGLVEGRFVGSSLHVVVKKSLPS